MVILNTDRGPVYYIKNKNKYGYKEDSKPIEEINGESTEQYLERLNNHLEYDTLILINIPF
jgi:predicted house-cleaning noncanonical NTP pyrophosphatase (MazG superfamily)